MAKPTSLDDFMRRRREEERGGAQHIYVMTPAAYQKYCSRCRRLIKAEDEGKGFFRMRVFCGAEECEKPPT